MSDPGAHRPRNAEATRADLLRAARRRFTLLGYDRTTTRDIAGDAGVNVSLINRYFGSKEGLFRTVVDSYADSLEQTRPSGREEIVDRILEGLAADAWPEFGSQHPLLLLLHDVGPDDPAAGLRRRALAGTIAGFAEQVGSPGADSGSDAESDDARLRGSLVLAMVAGLVTLRSALPDEPIATGDPERLRAALDAATRALLEPPG